MSASEIDALRPRKRGPLCTVCRLPEEVRADLRYGLSRGLECSVLARDFLAPKQYAISGGTLAKHFRENHEKRPE